MEFSANFEHRQQKKVVIANVLRKLQNVKDLVRQISKKRCFRTSLAVNMLKCPERL